MIVWWNIPKHCAMKISVSRISLPQAPRHVLHTITLTLSLSAPIIHNALQCQRMRGKQTKFWWMLWKTCLGCAALPYRHCSDSLAALSIDGGGGGGAGAGGGGRVGGGGGGRRGRAAQIAPFLLSVAAWQPKWDGQTQHDRPSGSLFTSNLLRQSTILITTTDRVQQTKPGR